MKEIWREKSALRRHRQLAMKLIGRVDTSEGHFKREKEQFLESIRASDAAVIASGTASLQTGLALKPFVIVYRVSPLTYMIARLLAETKYIGMVNVLADKEIVPELLQNKFTVSSITDHTVRLLPVSYTHLTLPTKA